VAGLRKRGQASQCRFYTLQQVDIFDKPST